MKSKETNDKVSLQAGIDLLKSKYNLKPTEDKPSA
jgi:hypothetical protein